MLIKCLRAGSENILGPHPRAERKTSCVLLLAPLKQSGKSIFFYILIVGAQTYSNCTEILTSTFFILNFLHLGLALLIIKLFSASSWPLEERHGLSAWTELEFHPRAPSMEPQMQIKCLPAARTFWGPIREAN
jgi:hypothetical protein